MLDYYEEDSNYPRHFDCIVGNPPYVGIEKDAENTMQSSSRSNLFIPFVFNLMTYSSSNSTSALVLPLSFAFNSHSSFVEMRRKIKRDNAEWIVEHYDRSPDSLFGDDVKSRNCIVFRNQDDNVHKIYSTGFLRWTSVTRSLTLTTSKKVTDITDLCIKEFIPKIGSTIEKDAFNTLVSNNRSILAYMCTRLLETDRCVAIKGTAYNWICAYDHIPLVKDLNGNEYISQDLKLFSTQNNDDAYFVLASINSTTAYWLWTVIGDGFHVTNRFLSFLCIDKMSFNQQQYLNMVALGKNFSTQLKKYPLQSTNSGKIITSYNHQPLRDVILQIDTLITDAMHLPCDFPLYLHNWYENMVSCGRNTIKSFKET
jgi:hypothetical protein